MPDPGVGPYRYVATAGGEHAPWYVMPFDKHGRCRAPRTRGHLIDTISSGQFSDVFLFSHGWNNDWDTATDRYRDFMDGFTTMRTEHALDVRPGYKPLLVGIIWPGTALVMPWEAAPRFAGGAPVHEPTDDRSGDAQRMIDEIADELPDDAVPRFYELMDQDEGLDRSDALELAEMLLEFGSDEVLPDGGAPAAADLVAAWSEAQVAYPTRAAEEALFDDTEFGTVDAAAPGPHAAGFFDRIDPRKVIRLATVLQMKDRAGVVGIHGVSPLLRDILGACSYASTSPRTLLRRQSRAVGIEPRRCAASGDVCAATPAGRLSVLLRSGCRAWKAGRIPGGTRANATPDNVDVQPTRRSALEVLSPGGSARI